MPEPERHHLFYPKSLWRGGPREELRQHPTSIIILDQASHRRLHRNLRPNEHLFRPELELVLGMLAVAEELDQTDSLENTVRRIRAQAEVAKLAGDKISRRMLGRQISWIERGYIGRRGRAGSPNSA